MEHLSSVSDRIQDLRARLGEAGSEGWSGDLLAILHQVQLAWDAARALHGGVADDYLTRAERLTGTQIARVQRGVVPSRLPGVTEAAVLDRKTDLVRLLDLQPPGDALVDYVVTLAREAIHKGDDLTLYTLTGGPLELYYRARHVEIPRIYERLLISTAGPADSRLIELLCGPDGLAALVFAMRQALRGPGMGEETAPPVPPVPLLRVPEPVGPADGAPEPPRPEDWRDVAALEEGFRQVAVIAGPLGTPSAGSAAAPGAPPPPTGPKPDGVDSIGLRRGGAAPRQPEPANARRRGRSLMRLIAGAGALLVVAVVLLGGLSRLTHDRPSVRATATSAATGVASEARTPRPEATATSIEAPSAALALPTEEEVPSPTPAPPVATVLAAVDRLLLTQSPATGTPASPKETPVPTFLLTPDDPPAAEPALSPTAVPPTATATPRASRAAPSGHGR